jgi:Molybdopterin oxidoreductase
LREKTDNWFELQGRLIHPMVKRAGATHYESIEWDEAFELLGRELNALPTPNAAAFYTSGRTSNEAAFLYQLFARQFGTNNLPNCSNMCHESNGVALKESIGIGKGYKNETRIARHFMVAPIEIARRCTATYFPEANVLVSINNSADRSNTPVSKSLVISIAPSKNTAAGVERILRESTQA